LLRTRDIEAARQVLTAAGQNSELLQDGSLQLDNTSSIERPDDIASLLVRAGSAPMQLMVEEEELEQYFLRLVGVNGSAK
jgi:ABC-2 type transport system ATP-binding protein